MFSDTCGGQNRNQNVAAVLLYAVHLIGHLKVTEQKFLEKGHTYMECDSMHSAIEFAQKNSSVFCVSAWKTIFEVARRKNPYEVHQLSHIDFSWLQSTLWPANRKQNQKRSRRNTELAQNQSSALWEEQPPYTSVGSRERLRSATRGDLVICRSRTQSLESASGRHSCDWLSQLL